jgi:hypothetical protein
VAQRPLHGAVDSERLLTAAQVFGGGGGVAHAGEVVRHRLFGRGGDLCGPEEGLELLGLEVLLESLVDGPLAALGGAIGVGKGHAAREVLGGHVRVGVDLLVNFGGVGSCGALRGDVVGVGPLGVGGVLFGLHGASGAAIGALVG